MASTGSLTPPRPDVRVLADSEALTRSAAEEVLRCASEAIRARGRFVIALSGGSTPVRLYTLLASASYARRVRWDRVHVCWGDERCVPPDDPASNYRMARSALLDHVPIPAACIHRMHGEDDPMRAAAAYAEDLRGFTRNAEDPPCFDLVLLGLGADGHTASLFPGTAAVHEQETWVVAHHVAAQRAWRITLTPVVINAAAEVMFLVAGAEKAPALKQVLEGAVQPDVLPAQAIAPRSGRLMWLVDAAAAAGLQNVEPQMATDEDR